MKKTISILLSLIFCLSLLTAMPAYASSSIRVPWTIKIFETGIRYTASYNASSKTLTYTTKTTMEEGTYDYDRISSMIALALSQHSQVSQKTRNEALAFDATNSGLYPCTISTSDPVRSGKINAIKMVTPLLAGNETGTRNCEYSFKRNKKGQVTTCIAECYNLGFMVIASRGGNYDFAYDSKGDLKSVKTELSHTPEYTATFTDKDGKLSKIIKQEEGYRESSSVKTDAAGRPVQVDTGKDSVRLSYDSQGRLVSIQYGQQDRLVLSYGSNGELAQIQESYRDYNGTPDTITAVFSYQEI